MIDYWEIKEEALEAYQANCESMEYNAEEGFQLFSENYEMSDEALAAVIKVNFTLLLKNGGFPYSQFKEDLRQYLHPELKSQISTEMSEMDYMDWLQDMDIVLTPDIDEEYQGEEDYELETYY